jgi:hypothetical protein
MDSLQKWKMIICIFRLSESKNIFFDSLVELLPEYKKKYKKKEKLTIKNQTVLCENIINNYFNMSMVIKLYKHWKAGNDICMSINARKMNIPEGISERIFCFHTGCIIVKDTKNLKSSSSFDCYNPHTKK